MKDILGKHDRLSSGVDIHSYDVPDDVRCVYRYGNGILFGVDKVGGPNYSINGNDYAYKIIPTNEFRTVYNDGFCDNRSAIADLTMNWLILAEVGDGDSIAVNLNENGYGEIIDIFHETAGMPGENAVICRSFLEWVKRSAASPGAWWLDGDRSKAY